MQLKISDTLFCWSVEQAANKSILAAKGPEAEIQGLYGKYPAM